MSYMCNIHNQNLKSRALLKNISVILLLIVAAACSPSESEIKEFDSAVSTRNAPKLFDYAESSNENVQNKAFRALISTSGIEDQLIDLVIKNPSEGAFRALTVKTLSPDQIIKLKKSFDQTPDEYKDDLIQLLGWHTDLRVFVWLVKRWKRSFDTDMELDYAMALSRQSLQLGFPDSLLGSWVTRTMASTEEKNIRSYLYGAYRAKHSIIKKPYDDVLLNYLHANESRLSALSTQYLVQVIAKQSNVLLLDWILNQDVNSMPVQVQLECVKAFAQYMYSPVHNAVFEHLLESKTDLVKTTLFDIVSSGFVWNESVKAAIEKRKVVFSNKYDAVTLASEFFLIKAFKKKTTWADTDFISVMRFYPYQLERAIELNRMVMSPASEMKLIEDYWEDVPVAGRFSLAKRYFDLMKTAGSTINPAFVDELLMSKDRGVMVQIGELLADKRFTTLYDHKKVIEVLSTLDAEADIEVYQTYIPLLLNFDIPEASALLDKLAHLPNLPLINSLKSFGYTGETIEATVNLAKPNRMRLKELGSAPIWTVQTSEGIIEIELEPEWAPTTVWLIDSLSNKGLFNKVAFHRIVPNFVVQGGDFERGDGYGGSMTTIPTEASEFEFERGVVGVASAGNDTESAQFFIMHQWQPHLNGRYTRFGTVIKGMEVADKLQRGDKIVSAVVE